MITSQVFSLPAEALWCHGFQQANTTWLFEQRIICGNFFLGLQSGTVQYFRSGIPKGAIIESAVMQVVAFNTSPINTFTTNLNSPVRGGTFAREAVGKVGEQTRWRPDTFSNADMDIRNDITTTQIQTSGGVNNAQWDFRQVASDGGPTASTWRDRMAQRFVPSSGFTLGDIVVQMLRTGSPTGNVRIKIMGATAVESGEAGWDQPDEVVLATSDDVVISSVGTTAGPVTFNFSGAEQITLNASTVYFAVVEPDLYNADNANRLVMRHQNQFLTIGRLLHYGTDQKLRWQNYPGTVEVFNSHCQPLFPMRSANTLWNIPQFIGGFAYNTPDITQMVQDQVNADDYDDSERVLLVCTGVNIGGNPNRIWRSPAHAVGPGPRLTVTYRPRRKVIL